MLQHDDIVCAIAAQVKAQVAKAQASQAAPVRIEKGGVSHFVPNPHAKGALPRIDCSQLTRILEIDTAARTCSAEAGVTFSALVRETLKHGFIPCCVPELRGITVGGAISGCSVESMSFRRGGFHDSCLEYEVVTGTGDVLTVGPEKDTQLFHMLHGSYGTLGIITRATFRLIPAAPYVKMVYRSFERVEDFWNELLTQCGRTEFDFIDGIIHAKNCFVLCLGLMVYDVPFLRIGGAHRPFYKSTREFCEDHLTTEEYLFRYDADCHWLTRTVPLLERPSVRTTFGRFFLGSTRLIRWSKRLAPLMRLKRRPDVVVDVFIPAARFPEFYAWYERDFDFYPLWIVPYRAGALYPWIDDAYAQGLKDSFFIDCAVYGKRNSRPDIDYSEVLEKKTVELGGIKTLISRNHFDEATFWRIYSRERYGRAKAVLDPHHLFQDLYEKFRP